MSAFLYGVGLQMKLDIRSKTMLITCYLLPLTFFLLVGGIFTAVMPDARQTLIQSMTVFGVSMGALIGLPPSLMEIYSGDIKKVYKANGVPLFLGVATNFLSSFFHLLVMSALILLLAPIIYNAVVPADLLSYFGALALFTATSLGIGSVLGLLVRSNAKLTMVAQVFFLPSIMLSGIMFPASMLPTVLQYLGKLFPAAWGFELMAGTSAGWLTALPLLVILALCAVACTLALRRAAK